MVRHHLFHLRLFVLIVALANTVSNAQTTVQIGFGTSAPTNTLYGPVYRFTAASATTGAQSIMLFTAAELNTAGIFTGDYITAVAFNKLNAFNFLIPAAYTMYMANTSATPPLTGTIATDWPTVLSTYTVVYSDLAFNLPAVAGWVTFNLSTPFQYTGGSLQIATDQVMTGGATGATGNFSWEYTTGFATSIIGAATGGGSNLSQYKQRPNIQISYTSTLGVDVVSLSARKSDNNIIIEWDVAGETDIAMYEVERSVNGKDFVKAGQVTAEGPNAISYSFTDRNAVAEGSEATLFYRLKCIETSGAYKYSRTALVKPMDGPVLSLAAFPGPVTDFVTIRIADSPRPAASITLTDASGKIIRKLAMANEELKIDMRELPGGLYLVTYSDGNATQTLKVSKR